METKRALIIGIDNYNDKAINNLNFCVNDAKAISKLLQNNENSSPNFAVKTLTNENATYINIAREIDKLFETEADSVLLYFAGHGYIDYIRNTGILVEQDYSIKEKERYGYKLSNILVHANRSHPNIKSTTIILDCCHSGVIGDADCMNEKSVSEIGKGVTFLTACSSQEVAEEKAGHGLFTSILIDSLEGRSADILGNITPASVYSHIDQALSSWEQRPMYKAHVSSFVCLRQVKPKVDIRKLRKLHELFISDDYHYLLDPSCEPPKDRGDKAEELKHIPLNPSKHNIYRFLQELVKNGLVIPCGASQPYMWHAAIESKGCKLTKLGQHYRNLSQKSKI